MVEGGEGIADDVGVRLGADSTPAKSVVRWEKVLEGIGG